jgi:DNA polymerase
MVEESTYGGKLAENVTQAVARDLLAAATVRLDKVEPYDLVVHVHDSLAAEVPKGEGDVDEFCRLLTTCPPWAKGLPLGAEGYRADYFKG